MMFLTCASLFVVLALCDSAKLPPHFIKCDRKDKDFQECMPKAVENAMRQLNQPIRELGLPSLNPLEVTELTIEAGTSAVGLRQKFKNLKIYGVNNLECSRMDIDFEKKTIENLCFYPEVRMDAEYELDGKVLLLDVRGKGPGDVTLEKLKIGVSYKLDEYEKNGNKHFKIRDIAVKLDPERVIFHLENSLDGFDPAISNNILQVINENWKEVFNDVKAHYEEAFGHIIKNVFNKLLSKVSVVDMFGKE